MLGYLIGVVQVLDRCSSGTSCRVIQVLHVGLFRYLIGVIQVQVLDRCYSGTSCRVIQALFDCDNQNNAITKSQQKVRTLSQENN